MHAQAVCRDMTHHPSRVPSIPFTRPCPLESPLRHPMHQCASVSLYQLVTPELRRSGLGAQAVRGVRGVRGAQYTHARQLDSSGRHPVIEK